MGQFEQTDWEVTTATVINVEAHRTVRHNLRDSSYDIYYQYEAGGNVYTGVIYRLNAGRKVGETFDVKYDPEAPQNATHYLELTSGFVVSGLFGFVVFGAIGIVWTTPISDLCAMTVALILFVPFWKKLSSQE